MEIKKLFEKSNGQILEIKKSFEKPNRQILEIKWTRQEYNYFGDTPRAS